MFSFLQNQIKKKLLIFWCLSLFFTHPALGITDNNNWHASDQNIDKKQEFYSHLCQLQTYMIDPAYKQSIQKKYASTVIYPKEILQKYNEQMVSDYTIQDLLNHPSLLSPFHIVNSATRFQKELELYNIAQLSKNSHQISQLLTNIPINKKLNTCLEKNYPFIAPQINTTLLQDKKTLLKKLYIVAKNYKDLITKNKIQLNSFKQLVIHFGLKHSYQPYQKAIKLTKDIKEEKEKTITQLTLTADKIHHTMTLKPLHNLLVRFQSKWSLQLGHYLYPQLSELSKHLIQNKLKFTKKTYALLKTGLRSELSNLQQLQKNICEKKITNLHHNILSAEVSILKHSAKSNFPLPIITEDLAAYCYLKNTQPKQDIKPSWKSYLGIGITASSLIARIFNWIRKKGLVASNLISTGLFTKDTYDNWLINSSQINLYKIDSYNSNTSAQELKKLKKNQDLIHLEGGLLILPALISKITNIVQAQKIQQIKLNFKLNPKVTISKFIQTSINKPSQWWPYYQALIKKLDTKQFKQFFWAKHEYLKKIQISKSHSFSKKTNELFSRLNKNYVTPARYLKNKSFVNTLVALKNAGKNKLSKKAEDLVYVDKLLSKTQRYQSTIDSTIEKGLTATAQLSLLNSKAIKARHFVNSQELRINHWPSFNSGKITYTDTISFKSYNNFKAFVNQAKEKSNYLPTRAIDDLFQKKQVYIEQLKQASNIRKLQIIENQLILLQKTQKLSKIQKQILNKIQTGLKQPHIFPPHRAFKKIFLKELSAEVKYLKQGIKKRQALVKSAYSSFPSENIKSLTKTSSFFTNHIKKIAWTGTTISMIGGATKGVQEFGLDYIMAQFQDKMRNISRFFSADGYTSEEKSCALESESFKKFILCYNKLVRQEIRIDLLAMRNFEFIQEESNNQDTEVYEYKIKLYSSIKQKLRDYTYKLLGLRSKFNIQEFFYNLKPQITTGLNEQFIHHLLKEIKHSLGEKSFNSAKAILTFKTNLENKLKAITNLSINIKTRTTNVTLLQSVLYQVYNNETNYKIYFKNTGQLPLELKALIKNTDLIELQEINEYEEFNTLSGGLLEDVDFFQNVVF